ncbi:MAG: cytochrome c [Acidobacteria bacterium]|nr:cytochrome c [Acidobacteriota bacterium]MBI3280060.1 cytochrome c [Acidobacteriota bacterium]
MAVRAASAPMQPAGTAAQPSPAPAPAAGTPPRLGQQAALPATFDPDLVTEFPMPVTRSLLERGRDRFNIFCTPCHGYTGRGNGMIVQRGLVGPKSFHLERLKSAPVGHFFEVITNGFGAMYSYAQRIPVQDRWAIVAYIRALQLSQGATLNDVPETERGRLGAPPPGREAMPGRTP